MINVRKGNVKLELFVQGCFKKWQHYKHSGAAWEQMYKFVEKMEFGKNAFPATLKAISETWYSIYVRNKYKLLTFISLLFWTLKVIFF